MSRKNGSNMNPYSCTHPEDVKHHPSMEPFVLQRACQARQGETTPPRRKKKKKKRKRREEREVVEGYK